MNCFRESPLHCRPMAQGAQTEAGDSVTLTDVSLLAKTGLKGPAAAAWLEQRGIPVPQQYNSWVQLPAGGVIARLAISEFFIEDAPDGGTATGIAQELESPVAGVWPVLRQDAGIVLAGNRITELLVQTCSFNFADLGTGDKTVVMTSMAGVGVLAIRDNELAAPSYRIWCDPTYAPYLYDTLAGIAAEINGDGGAAQAFTGQHAS